jgi:hypothetical protein
MAAFAGVALRLALNELKRFVSESLVTAPYKYFALRHAGIIHTALLSQAIATGWRSGFFSLPACTSSALTATVISFAVRRI